MGKLVLEEHVECEPSFDDNSIFTMFQNHRCNIYKVSNK